MSDSGSAWNAYRNTERITDMEGGRVKDSELIIIGAGPGGIAAAVEAAKAGVTTAIIDENQKPGGRIYCQFNDGFKLMNPKFLGSDYVRGKVLLAEFDSCREKIQYLEDTLVFGIFENRIMAFHQAGKGHSIPFNTLIVATGAYDRPVAFPGWTLPGVLTAGGAQTLVKMQRVLPGKNILFAGTGPLQLVVANQVLDGGGKVAAILEAGEINNWLKLLKGFYGNWGLLRDGLKYIRRIRQAGVPMLRRHIILEARGDRHVEEAVVAEVDNDWRALGETRRVFKADAICIGYGLVPSVEIKRLTGCKHRYEPRLGGWIPVRNENLETSVPGVFAVGDGAGVAGSSMAMFEGRIAGNSIAQSLGYITSEEAEKRKKPYLSEMKKIQRLRDALDRISYPRPGVFELAKEDTIICRCEELTLGDIKEIIDKGTTEMNELKRLTRMGMGRCQGRMCAPTVQEIIARQTKLPAEKIEYLNQRPPTKLVPIDVLASLPGEFEPRHGW
jgi:thioredoxin reductase/bacterioferritin-associated ferredoxin